MLRKFLKGLMSLFAPPVVAPATIMAWSMAQPVEKKTPASNFHHILGDFDKAVIVVKGQEVDLKALRGTAAHTAAKGSLSENFRIVVDDKTFVLWNKPSEAQRKIQTETADGDSRRNVRDLGALDDTLISLKRSGISIESAKPSFNESFSLVSRSIHERLENRRRSRQFTNFMEQNPSATILARMSAESRINLDNN